MSWPQRREIIRLGLQVNIEETDAKTDWRIYIASLAASGTGDAPNPKIVEVHHRAGQNYSGRFTPLFRDLMGMYGLQCREPVTIDQSAAASSATSDGTSDPEHMGFEPRTEVLLNHVKPAQQSALRNVIEDNDSDDASAEFACLRDAFRAFRSTKSYEECVERACGVGGDRTDAAGRRRRDRRWLLRTEVHPSSVDPGTERSARKRGLWTDDLVALTRRMLSVEQPDHSQEQP